MTKSKKVFWLTVVFGFIGLGFIHFILAAFDVINTRLSFLLLTIYNGITAAALWALNIYDMVKKKSTPEWFDGLCVLALFIALLIFTIAAWDKL